MPSERGLVSNDARLSNNIKRFKYDNHAIADSHFQEHYPQATMHGRRAAHPGGLVSKPASMSTSSNSASSPTTDNIDDEGDLSLASRALHSPTQSAFSSFSNVHHAHAHVHAHPHAHAPPGVLRRSSSHGHASPAANGHHHLRKRIHTLTRANPLPTSVLPQELLERLRQVIDSICVVNFDIDIGPGWSVYQAQLKKS